MLDTVPIRRIYKQGAGKPKSLKDKVAAEHSLMIRANETDLVALLCSPEDLEYLAVGFLFSEGLIQGKQDIKEIVQDETNGIIDIATVKKGTFSGDTASHQLIGSSGARTIVSTDRDRGAIESALTITPAEIFGLIEEFVHRSQVFATTGGVHSAALCGADRILVFSEDIGRHNALDKVFGECLLRALPTEEHIVITSGRVSSEIVKKAARSKVPVLISKSAPTNRGVQLAADLGITLIGFVREERMNLYTHTRRVVSRGT